MKNSKSGFSLVELMVVVAIIGILATIAVPNFQRFQARAKQSSAKTELSGIYTAQKAFYVEYNSYHPDLQMTGFAPEGITLADAADPVSNDVNRIYASTGGPIVDTAGYLNYAALGLAASKSYANTAATPLYPANAQACDNAVVTYTNIVGVTAPAFARDTFSVVIGGCPRGKSGNNLSTNIDVWSINQVRALANTQNGI